MDDEDDDCGCPICFEEFLYPKLLACGHTFCLSCLQMCHKKSDAPDKRETVRCPLCQTLCVLPCGRMQDLLTNYFVPDRFCRIIQKICKVCKRAPSYNTNCKACAPYQEIGGENNESGEDSADKDDMYYRKDATFPYVLKTVSIADKVWKQKLEGTSLTSTICPTTNNECFVLMDNSSSIIRIDASGNVKARSSMKPNSKIYDISCRSDGARLVLIAEPHRILLFKGNTASTFPTMETSCMEYSDMDIFQDDTLVLIGIEKVETPTKAGFAIVDTSGNFVRQLTKTIDEFRPYVVRVNRIKESICVSNMATQSVDIFLPDGTFLRRFNGWLNVEVHKRLGLTPVSVNPLGVACDRKGNILFVDGKTGSIYILDCNGDFLGILLSSCQDMLGSPLSLACTDDESIWVGDSQDGTIRKFRVFKYLNNVILSY